MLFKCHEEGEECSRSCDLPQGALIVQHADRQKENKLGGTCEQNLSLSHARGVNLEHLSPMQSYEHYHLAVSGAHSSRLRLESCAHSDCSFRFHNATFEGHIENEIVNEQVK